MAALSSRATHGLDLARRRARRRKKSAGAAVFIVAVTLGVLAVMGVYALSATSNEVRSAGQVREAMQAQRVAEFAVMAAGETLSPAVGGALIQKARNPDPTNGRSTNCKSSKPPSTDDKFRDAEACVLLTEEQMKTISGSVNRMIGPAAPSVPSCGSTNDCPFFFGDSTAAPGSLGPVVNRPFLRVEITNPVDVPPPPGMSLDNRWTFTQVTATVYVDMKPNKTDPASTSMLARGRLTVGPYAR
jgi:type II secretory pathway pseudopilin PulG